MPQQDNRNRGPAQSKFGYLLEWQGTVDENDLAIGAVGNALGFHVERLDAEPLVEVRGSSEAARVDGFRGGGRGRGGSG